MERKPPHDRRESVTTESDGGRQKVREPLTTYDNQSTATTTKIAQNDHYVMSPGRNRNLSGGVSKKDPSSYRNKHRQPGDRN